MAKGGELKRIKECAGLSQRVAEEAEAFVRRFFEVVAGFPPEVVAVAVLWTAAEATGAPRPLEDFLKCSKAGGGEGEEGGVEAGGGRKAGQETLHRALRKDAGGEG